jgi:hypothetical protein
MILIRALLYLSYFLSFNRASAGASDEHDPESSSEEGEPFTEVEIARLRRLIREGDDDPQAIATLFDGRTLEYDDDINGYFETLIKRGHTKSFEYLFENVHDKDQDDVVGLIGLALEEHRPEACRFLMDYDPQSNYALIHDDHYYGLLGFWGRRPFLWTEDELDALLDDCPDLIPCICPPTDRFFPYDEGERHDWSPEVILMAIRLTLNHVASMDDMEWHGDDYEPDNMLHSALAWSTLGDEDLAQVIQLLLDAKADVSEEMRERFFRTRPEPDYVRSRAVVGDAAAAHKDATHLKQLLAGGDFTETVAAYVRGHPLRIPRYVMEVLKKTIDYGRIGCFEYLLPFTQDFPAAGHDRHMSHLFFRAIRRHQPEMCRILLAHGFNFEHEHAGYSLSKLLWSGSPFLWAEDELLEIISHAPSADLFCLSPEEWPVVLETVSALSLVIKTNLRYGAGLGKGYVDPTAMLRAVLRLAFPDAQLAGVVRQLVELGAEVTEGIKGAYVHHRRSMGIQERAAVLKALDDALAIPDVKEAEA